MENNILKLVYSLDIQKLLSDNNNTKHTILDPINCILKITLLNYLPSKTKLSINNNKIEIQEPGYIQPLLRWSNGDSRLDLTLLFYNILLFNEYYLDTEYYDFFIDKTSYGLKKLEETYETDDNTKHLIKYYIYVLNDKNRVDNDKKYQEYKKIILSSGLSDSIQKLWNENEYKIAHDIIKQIDENTNKKLYIKLLIELTKGKEDDLHNLIKKIK